MTQIMGNQQKTGAETRKDSAPVSQRFSCQLIFSASASAAAIVAAATAATAVAATAAAEQNNQQNNDPAASTIIFETHNTRLLCVNFI